MKLLSSFSKGIFAFISIINYTSGFSQTFNRPVYDTVTTQGIRYQAQVGGLASTSNQTPFWLRSNEFGTIPLESPGGILSVGATGLWGNAQNMKKLYAKASFEAVGNATRNSRFILPEAYAAVGLGHAELYVGRRREINGLTDTLLGSGSYAYSGNAVPITQIRIGTKDFAPLHFTNDIIAFNGFISHGWISNTDSMKNAYLHAKSLFVRIGKPSWKVRFYGGMAQYVQWGGYSKYLDNSFSNNGHLPSDWKAFKKAWWPSALGGNDLGGFTKFDSLNRSGNHLGSIDIALEISLKNSNLFFYIQRPWDDMSGVVFGNLPDGVYGVRWQNHNINDIKSFRFKQITAEFMTTLDQSGPYDAKTLPKGADDYFNNYQYIDGWTNEKRVIGTPFFTRWMDSNPKWHNLPAGRVRQMISNNKVQLLHIGLLGQFASGISLRTLLSQSWNYGRPTRPDPISVFKQFSGLVEIIVPSKTLSGLEYKASFALDAGDWLPNSIGLILGIKKTGWF
ncbi:capsule assembly Wzi family protein [Siphonobacter curvatus]|uniref:Capsule assembly Wzi family protein n=1 Tax=Siphonobacter curvatus TaxID=2094562 RepID=A0A2S7IEG9_9BACT|nr:capsule assembly Wzi family protein [Siphonobacter curvatus]PQA52725.1 hypothetical protein C5O19_25750 [Siphonobacter curvatus]